MEKNEDELVQIIEEAFSYMEKRAVVEKGFLLDSFRVEQNRGILSMMQLVLAQQQEIQNMKRELDELKNQINSVSK